MYLAQSRLISYVAAPLHCLMKFQSNIQLSLRCLTMSVVRKISASIGVIALLMATPVLAAKIKKAPKPPLPPPVLVFSWTGYYVGANAGGVCTNAVANRGVIGNPPLPGVPNGLVDFSDRITLLGQYPNFLGPKLRFHRRRPVWLQLSIVEYGLGH
jgi:hypothetical protein